MLKFLFLLLIPIWSMPLLGQELAIDTEGKQYKGYIFPKSLYIPLKLTDLKVRYSPTIQDINDAELILKKEINDMVRKKKGKIKSQTLKSYTRQYVGYINNKGDTIIYINLYLTRNIDKNKKSKFKEELQLVLDGGDDYWQICVNLNQKQLFDLHINGIT